MKIEKEKGFFKISKVTITFLLIMLFSVTFCIVNIPIIKAAEPSPPSGFVATAYNRTQIDLSWTNADINNTYIEWNTTENWGLGNGTLLYNGTGTSTLHSGLTPFTVYYYQAWSYNVTDNVFSSTNVSGNDTTLANNLPIYVDFTVLNGSANQEVSLFWNVTINDVDGDTFNWTIWCSNSQSNFGNDESNGTKSLSLTGLNYSVSYTVWVNATDLYGTNSSWYTFTTGTPSAPSAFTVVAYNRTLINLSWANAVGSDNTYIEWNTSESWDIGDGTLLYNGTDSLTSQSGLSPSTVYYYQAWSYNVTDNVYSSTNASGNDSTLANNLPMFVGFSVSNGSVGQQLSLLWDVIISDTDGDTFNWTIWCNNSQTNSSNNDTDGVKSLELTGLDYSSSYLVWVNATDLYDTNSSWYTFSTRAQYIPGTPGGFTVTAYNRTQIYLNWSNVDFNNTYIEWNSTSDSWTRGDGTLLYNGTDSFTSHSSLAPSTVYYYQAWSWNETDNVFSSTNVSGNDTTLANNLPIYVDFTVLNGSLNQEVSLFWNVSINDFDGDTFNWTIWCSNSQSSFGNDESNGTKSLGLTGLNYSVSYTVWVNATDLYGTNSSWYTFTTGTPSAPSAFTVVAYNRTLINLSWTNSVGSDNTYIEWNTSESWGIGEGILLYNGTDSLTSHSGLVPSTVYYYQAWSYNASDNIFSASNVSGNDTTSSNSVAVISGVNPSNWANNTQLYPSCSVTVTDSDSDILTVKFYEFNGSSWILQQTNSSVSSGLNIIWANYSNASGYYATYNWSVNISDGYDWTNATYNFTTISENLPNPPSSFSATSGGTSSISLSWTKGYKADYTYIEWNTVSSWSKGSGTQLYNNTGTSTSHTSLNPSTTINYQAWSWNSTGGEWSLYNATASATTDSGGGGYTPPPSNLVPTAEAGGPYSGYTNAAITFTGSGTDSDGTIAGYKWDWTNDGTYDTDWLTSNTTTHTYLSAGTYTVKLQVKDDDDATSSDTATVTITETSIQQYQPIAITNGPYSALTFENIVLDGTQSSDLDGTITNYTWNLGDGTTVYGATVIHYYNTSGLFYVTLTVKDNDGLTNASTTNANITLDSDADGWSDELEESYGLNATDPDSNPIDTDGDGIPDEDSLDGKYIGDDDDDNDGIDDETEIDLGSNPSDAFDVKTITIEETSYYLIDTNSDGNLDKFYDSSTQKNTVLKFENGKYLIDTNGDGEYNYIYDPASGEVSQYTEEEPQGEFPWFILIIIAIVLIIILIVTMLFKTGYLYLEEEPSDEEKLDKKHEKKEQHKKTNNKSGRSKK